MNLDNSNCQQTLTNQSENTLLSLATGGHQLVARRSLTYVNNIVLDDMTSECQCDMFTPVVSKVIINSKFVTNLQKIPFHLKWS